MPSKTRKKKTKKAAKRKAVIKRPRKRPAATKRSRASTEVERNVRQAQVARLRFVQHWSFVDIANTLDVSTKTVERDLESIRRRMRARAARNLTHEIRDIAEELKLSFDEKIKLLWQEYIALTHNENSGKKKKLGLQTRYQLLSIFKQITQTENSHVEQLGKLGIVGSGFESDDGEEGSFLLQIKARHAKIISSRDSAAGGGDGKPSAKT